VAVVSPPLGTTKSVSKGSVGAGIAHSTVGRRERVFYAYPGVGYFFKQLVTSGEAADGMCDIPAATALASLMSQIRPEQNPGKRTDTQHWSRLEAACQSGGTIGPLTKTDYKSFRAYGIVAPRVAPGYGAIFQSGVTSVDPILFPTKQNINTRRFADYIVDTLSLGLLGFSKEDGSQENRDAITAIIQSFGSGLVQQKRCRAFGVNSKSGNTFQFNSKGAYVWSISCGMNATLDNIVLITEIGAEVNVTEA
jgi:hypothetical protein